jgi:hypothetical protein
MESRDSEPPATSASGDIPARWPKGASRGWQLAVPMEDRVGRVICAGFTMYDFQRLRKTKDIRAAPLLAASIFLDVLNVFLLLLSLFNRR